MDNDFTAAEIGEAITAARIFSLDYGQEQFQVLRELERRLQDSGYVEVVGAVARFEQERGIRCTEVLAAVEQLLSDKEQLEAEIATLEEKRTQCQQETQQAEETLGEVEIATEQAKDELQATQTEHQKEEKELVAFRGKADKEKRAIDNELEQCRQEAKVTREEVVTAGQLKAEVEKHGFTLELALGLSQEFAGSENIRDKLAEGLKSGQTLTKYIEEAEERNKRLQTDARGLAGECQQAASNLSQLRADVAFEEKVRQFYHRYQGAAWLMDQLASWRSIFFVRCGNPLYVATSVLDRSTRGGRFWTEKKPIARCPDCDYPGTFYDEELYQALNWTIGEPFQLNLGE